MVNFVEKPRYGYDDLLEIIRILRSPEGCPCLHSQRLAGGKL